VKFSRSSPQEQTDPIRLLGSTSDARRTFARTLQRCAEPQNFDPLWVRDFVSKSTQRCASARFDGEDPQLARKAAFIMQHNKSCVSQHTANHRINSLLLNYWSVKNILFRVAIQKYNIKSKNKFESCAQRFNKTRNMFRGERVSFLRQPAAPRKISLKSDN